MPADCQAVLTAIGRQGDFKDNALKLNIPRSDLHVVTFDRPKNNTPRPPDLQNTVVAFRKSVSPCVDRWPNAAVPRWYAT